MTKKEMAAKIAALEAQVAALSIENTVLRTKANERVVGQPHMPWQPPEPPYRVTFTSSLCADDLKALVTHNVARRIAGAAA